MTALVRANSNRSSAGTPPTIVEPIMTTHRIRKSSTYRFHDSVRNDRKFMLAAVAAALATALILLALFSGLGLDLLHTTVK